MTVFLLKIILSEASACVSVGSRRFIVLLLYFFSSEITDSSRLLHSFDEVSW